MRWAMTAVLISAPFWSGAGAQGQESSGSATGTVTASETGQPLAGAQVTIDGTDHSTLTGSNGRFAIAGVPPGTYRLTVTLIGYADFMTAEVVVSAGEAVSADVQLEAEAVELAEVVAVAYGQQRRATITGSVSSVQGEALTTTPVANVTNALAGRLAGVIVNNRGGIPGADDATILIRGTGTIGDLFDPDQSERQCGDACSPLIVIDGVAGRSDFGRLNPEDIESVTVLKDASAAIYGAQAGNGVIVVQTKRGGGAPRFTYNATVGVAQATALPEFVNSADFATYINELNESLGTPPQYTEKQIQGFREGSDPLLFANTDWIDAVTKNAAPQTDHRLTVSGGTDRVSYFVSGQYLYQDAIFENSAHQFRQYNLRSNLTAQLTDNLNVSVQLAGRVEDRDRTNQDPDNTIEVAASNNPTIPAFYPNGLPSTGIEFNNPAVWTDGTTGTDDTDNWIAESTLNFRWDLPSIMEGLYLAGFAAADVELDDGKTFDNEFEWVQFEPSTGEFVSFADRTGPITVNKWSKRNLERTLNVRLGLDRAFGRHLFQVFAAHERFKADFDSVAGFRTDLPSDRIQELFAGGPDGIDNGSAATERGREHYFGRLSYSFDDKYLAEFTLRHDGSDRFPPGRRWGTFPGVSAGWRISREPFFNVGFIDDLKLKASWGRLGNDQTGAFQFLPQFKPVETAHILGENPGRVRGVTADTVPNPNITWETVDKLNFGVEATMFDGRLSMDFNVFHDDRDGILITRGEAVPTYTGFDLPAENLGKTSKTGFDGMISYRESFGDFRLDLSPNFTYVKSRTDFIDEAADIPAWQRREGFPLDSYLLYESCGIFRSQEDVDSRPHFDGTLPGDICFVDTDEDGAITANDRIRVFDSPTPNFQYGVNTGFGYKGVQLDLVWQGQLGASLPVMPQRVNRPITPPQWLFEDRWTEDNPDAKWPRSFDRRNSRNNDLSTFWLRDASYLRLKSASLSYTLPRYLVTPFRLDDMRLYFQAYNLFTVAGIENYDPELNQINTYKYPQTRVMNFGVSVSF